MKRLFAISFLLLLLTHCHKKPIEWDVDLNAPLFKTDLSIANLLPDSMISSDENHLLSLVIHRDLFSLSANSFTALPDSIFELYIPLSAETSLTPNTLLFYKDDIQKMKLDPVELTKTAIYKGYITFKVINPFDQPIQIHYQIPEAKKNGISFSEKIIIPKGNASGNTLVQRVDLSGYELDLRGPNRNNVNSYQHILTVRISPTASDSAHTVGSELLLKISFDEIELAYGKGYFGQQTLNYGPDTSTIHFFDFYQDGVLDIEKIDANFTIQNGIGADLQFNLLGFKGINTKTMREVEFQSSIIGRPLNISRAMETQLYTAPVTPFVSSYDISHSNILAWLTNFPDQLQYQAWLHFNPLGNVSAGNDFVYHQSDFKAQLHAEIPFSFSATALVLQKEVEYSLGKDVDDINELTLYLIAENGYPLTCELQLDVIDHNGNSLFSLFSNEKTISSATLIQEGNTLSTQSVLPIKLDSSKIALLKKEKKMRITATLHTEPAIYTKIYDTYSLKLQLTGKIGYHIRIE